MQDNMINEFVTDCFDPYLTAVSGQVFRMRQLSEKLFLMLSGSSAALLEQRGVDRFAVLCPQEEFGPVWRRYLDLDTDYDGIIRQADSSDIFLSEAAKAGRGIRLLRQQPFEALVSFIISQNNNIPRITKCIEGLCSRFGERIKPELQEMCGDIGYDEAGERLGVLYSFPSIEALAGMKSVKELDGLGLGYRDEYIFELVKDQTLSKLLEELGQMSYDDAMKRLMSIKGIGRKVANCMCLYGLHKVNACPVDVWIQRIIDGEYAGVKPAWMDSEYAGIYQQYAFYYKRTMKETERK